MDASDNQIDAPEPASLRRLRQLVTTLMVTLILGMVIMVGLLVFRVGFSSKASPLPNQIELPVGEVLTGFSSSADWTVLITKDGEDVQRVHLVPNGKETITQTVTIKSSSP